jgi:hypothetical protein
MSMERVSSATVTVSSAPFLLDCGGFAFAVDAEAVGDVEGVGVGRVRRIAAGISRP